MATGVVAGFILCIPIAVLMLVAAIFLVILAVVMLKKGNKTLGIAFIIFTLLPFTVFLIFVVMIAIYAFEVLSVVFLNGLIMF